MKYKEYNKFKQIAKDYFDYILNNKSYLAKILLIFKMENTYFLIMNNVTYINTNISIQHTYYDLKGSKINRYSSPDKTPLKD